MTDASPRQGIDGVSPRVAVSIVLCQTGLGAEASPTLGAGVGSLPHVSPVVYGEM